MKDSVRKIFIANRGEIARRISDTATQLGIKTVAIKGHAFAPSYLSPFVSEFVFVPDETTATYLNQNLMIELALKTGCNAIHPGFGFLSENADFARKCINAGLLWIGPNPDAIEAMASKSTARTYAVKATVPVVPGIEDIDTTDIRFEQQILKFSKQWGFPILLKAAFGGGGKGMRIANTDSELIEQAHRAHSEALSSFGNGLLIAERYLARSRHVEVQVLSDQKGNIAILGDRDCSLQRRHQKIVEEAPAPFLPDAMRKEMHESARLLAKAVNYDSAGTVEFIVELDKNGNPKAYYFLEMNTRLQVEHCVTEEVFGLDLVEWQIRVANGESLSDEILKKGFCNFDARGHSIECRVYAEDTEANFFPSPGYILGFEPHLARSVRWEIGIDTIDEVTSRFDPMISKVIVHCDTREKALERMSEVLKSTRLLGVKNNLHYLSWLCAHPEVRHRVADTGFIQRTIDSYLQDLAAARTNSKSLVDSMKSLQSDLPDSDISQKSDIQTIANLCFNSNSELQARQFAVTRKQLITNRRQTFASNFCECRVDDALIPYAQSQIGGEKILCFIDSAGVQYIFKTVEKSLENVESTQMGSDALSAPVPGKVVAVNAKPGQRVVGGIPVIILESMKMQFEVKATSDETVDKIFVKAGDIVTQGQKLLQWVGKN